MKTKNMKIIISLIIGLIIFLPFINAHALEKGPININSTNYNINFITIQKYPVINKETLLDFDIKNKKNEFIGNLNISLKLILDKKKIDLLLNQENKGHYNIKYKFLKPGNYKINIFINGRKINEKINLKVDSLGLSAILRGGFIIFLILIILGFIFKECKNKNEFKK